MLLQRFSKCMHFTDLCSNHRGTYGHTTLNMPHFLRSHNPSMVGPG